MTTIVVMAKECIPGKVKTRLNPPFTLDQAAEIASACLADTLELVRSVSATRRILCIDQTNPGSFGAEFEVLPQGGGGLDDRIAAVLDVCDGPTFLIGMDTPQLCASDFGMALGSWPSDVDAYFGPAADGGYWGLGLREPDGDLVRGVPMSREDTGAVQRKRLDAAGLRTAQLTTHVDLDDAPSLEIVRALVRTESHVNRVLVKMERER